MLKLGIALHGLGCLSCWFLKCGRWIVVGRATSSTTGAWSEGASPRFVIAAGGQEKDRDDECGEYAQGSVSLARCGSEHPLTLTNQ